MYKTNKNGKVLNVLLGIIALFVIIFIIAWIVQKGSNTAKYNRVFDKNIQTMHENAKDYFAEDLPSEIGETTVLTLKDLYNKKLVNKLTYGKTACDEKHSYISATKLNSTEYKIKTNLVCGSKNDTISEKITTKTVVNDQDGNIIIDD